MKNMILPDISYQRGILSFWDYIFMNIHCPNSGPHFTPYRTYTTVAFLYREKIYARVVMLYSKKFYSSPASHTWPGIIFLPVPVILCIISTKFTTYAAGVIFSFQSGPLLSCADFFYSLLQPLSCCPIFLLHLHKTSITSSNA
jgi:hypothetical protein